MPQPKEIRVAEAVGGNFGGIGSLSSAALERFKPIFGTRSLIFISFGCNILLFFITVVLYSIIHSQTIRLEGLTKRVQFISLTMDELIHGQQNSEKLEKLDERVANMKSSMSEIKDIIEESTGADHFPRSK